MLSLSDLFDLTDVSAHSPFDCHVCKAYLACLRPPRLDEGGQWHLDEVSRVHADLPGLHSWWFREDGMQARVWAVRGESHVLQSLRGERSYWRGLFVPVEGELGGPRIVQLGEYCEELDGDPEEDW